MTNKHHRLIEWGRAPLAALALVLLLTVTACGPKEEPKAPPGPAPKAAVDAPALKLLQLMPETAMIAVAVPPWAGLHDRGTELAQRLGHDPAEIDAMLVGIIDSFYEGLALPEADTFPEKMAAMGFDPEAAMGVYVDLSPLAEEFERQAAVLEAGASETGAPDATDQLLAEVMTAQMQEELPAVAKVLTCRDTVTAEQHLKEMAARFPGVDLTQVENVAAHGVTIHSYSGGAFAYFFSDDRVVAGNSLDLVQGVAARMEQPEPLAYDAVAIGASGPDTLVAFTRLDRLMALSRRVTEAGSHFAPPGLSGMVGLQEGYDAYSDDPLITTLEWDDERIELRNRINAARHPKALELAGRPGASRLATLLPASTVAFLDFSLTPEAKQMWQEMDPSVAQANPMMAQSMVMVQTVLNFIGEELTLGITGQANGLPQAALLIDLQDPDAAKGFMQGMGLPMTPLETYADVEIIQLPVPFVPVFMAFAGNTLVAANDLTELKALIDGAQGDATGDFFESLTPTLDVSTPRYGALVIKNALYFDVAKPVLSAQGGTELDQQAAPFERAANVFREVRLVQEINGDWLNQIVTVYMTPE